MVAFRVERNKINAKVDSERLEKMWHNKSYF
jgi:hypothetical protein